MSELNTTDEWFAFGVGSLLCAVGGAWLLVTFVATGLGVMEGFTDGKGGPSVKQWRICMAGSVVAAVAVRAGIAVLNVIGAPLWQ